MKKDLSLLLTIIIILLTLSACGEGSESITESNFYTSEGSEENTLPDSDAESSISMPEVSSPGERPEGSMQTEIMKQIKCGEVSCSAKDGEVAAGLKLAEWFSKHMYAMRGSFKSITQDRKLRFIQSDEFALYTADYIVELEQENGETEEFGFSILFAVKKDSGVFYLIDGKIGRHHGDYGYLTPEAYRDGFAEHELFGNYANTFLPQGVEKGLPAPLYLPEIIGEQDTYTSFLLENELLALVVNDGNDGNNKKIIIVDLKTKKKLSTEYRFGDLLGKNTQINRLAQMTTRNIGVLELDFTKNGKQIYAKLVFDTTDYRRTGKIKYELILADDALTRQNIRSHDGKYEAIHNADGLFILDASIGKKTLVSKRVDYVPDENDKIDVKYPYAAFFVGNTLYYNINGYEWTVGNGFYNADTRESKEFANLQALQFFNNGFLYTVSNGSNMYMRYPAGNDSMFQQLPVELSEMSYYDISPDKKLLAVTNADKQEDGQYKNTIILFDTATFKEVKRYTLTVSYEVGYIFFVGNYLYVMSMGRNLDYLYMIDLGNNNFLEGNNHDATEKKFLPCACTHFYFARAGRLQVKQ